MSATFLSARPAGMRRLDVCGGAALTVPASHISNGCFKDRLMGVMSERGRGGGSWCLRGVSQEELGEEMGVEGGLTYGVWWRVETSRAARLCPDE